MKPNPLRRLAPNPRWLTIIALALIGCVSNTAAADQIQMQNGDRYFGKVLSLNGDTLVLQSDVLGTLRLPRANVALISFGATPVVNAPSGGPTGAVGRVSTNTPSALAGPLRQLTTNSNLIQRIQNQYLSDAGPGAKDKFNELLGGLMSGKLGVEDIRAEAQSTANQVRAMRKDLGEDAGWMLDTYLAILDQFVNENAPPSNTATNAPAHSKAPSSGPAAEAD